MLGWSMVVDRLAPAKISPAFVSCVRLSHFGRLPIDEASSLRLQHVPSIFALFSVFSFLSFPIVVPAKVGNV